MKKILFVCLGNICRSPMAEVVFREKVKRRGLEKEFIVDSAATSGWEQGNPVHRGTRKVLKEHGMSSKGLTSRKVTAADYQRFDYLIGMDFQNVADLEDFAPEETHATITSFLSVVPNRENEAVPDPYYTGDFEQTYRLVDEGTEKWLEKLINE
ncbi:MAG: low molecular weight phosphotyrosine protein phosphatase [Lactobacillales bacterium]|jgi:protein-tyrosine phosphatase|nr:low molecular weight phosphotyrosine protein phosphatase [Lactobacillales bacterium]